MTESGQPLFSPAAFEVMSALVLRSNVPLGELAELSKQSPAALQATLQRLTERDYVAEAADPTSSAPAYRATARGQSAFFEHVDWLKRKMTEQE